MALRSVGDEAGIRTYSARIDKSGIACENCGTPYDVCTDNMLDRHKACCGGCQIADTHRERNGDVQDGTRLYLEGAVSMGGERSLTLLIEDDDTHTRLIEVTLTGQQVFDLINGAGVRASGTVHTRDCAPDQEG